MIFFTITLEICTRWKDGIPHCVGWGVLSKSKYLMGIGKLLSENIKGCCGKVAGYLLIICALLSQQIQMADEELPGKGHISSPPFV